MSRAALVPLVLVSCVAWGQSPSYTATSIVNASDYMPGPFAANSVLSLFGQNLAWSTRPLASSDIAGGILPTQLAAVSVYVDNFASPLLYVSPTQINFVIPSYHNSGSVPVRVVREGVSGPEVTVTLVDAAPALFLLGNGYVIATHANGSLLTADSPAQAGETIVAYATGLGWTQPNPGAGVIPLSAATIQAFSGLSISLGGAPLDPIHIKYAGLTPYSVGLYQLNLELPPNVPSNPTIVVTIEGQATPSGLQLFVQ